MSVYSKNFKNHLEHVRSILDRLRKAGLKLKPSKCWLGASKVKYLGHYLSPSGIEMEQAKMEAVSSFPTPKNVKYLRSFLGLCNYYRKIVKGFAKIVSPSNELLKKEQKFEWSREADDAFQYLKQ